MIKHEKEIAELRAKALEELRNADPEKTKELHHYNE